MFSELKGKRLLILGGIKRTRAIVRRAQQLGVYVIVADFDPHSPAKEIADEAVLIDAKDVDKIAEYCIANKVDGITTAYVDFLLPVCMEVGKRIGKPFYADEMMIRLSTDKIAFKECCEQYGVPVPKTYNVSVSNYRAEAKHINYPVFIKPTDASGSRGADICRDPEDFCFKYETALSFSRKKEVTVEEYLSGTEFILDYVLIDGEPYMVSMADRFTSEGRPVAINHPNLMILPSKNLKQYCKEIDPKVRNMFRKLGFRNGVIFLQGYVNGEKITFYEMGCRLGGTWPYIDEAFQGFNPIDFLVSHAVTGRMVPEGTDVSSVSPFFNGLASVIYFIAAPGEGRIEKVTGLEEIRQIPEVVTTLQYYREGDPFCLGTLTDVLFLAVHIAAADYESLNRIMEKVYSGIDYLDENGRSLLSKVIHLDSVTGNGTDVYKSVMEEQEV